MQDWADKIPPLVLAIMGGVAEFLMSEKHSWTHILVSMFLAGFTGWLILLICIEYQVSEGLTGVACGMGGMSSRSVLLLFKKVFMDKIKLYISTPGNSNGGKAKDDKPEE